MNKKANPIYGIRAKLLSAVSMLLVAVIMVISSTYAWFTLSTAPEVKGISTAIGANGALEMALVYTDENGNIQNVREGAVQSGLDRNTYWGNLVDVSTKEGRDYGVDKITLLPSVLVSDSSIPVGTSILAIPEYGTDGRVDNLNNESTVTGVYDETANGFVAKNSYGFRAIGVTSGLTARNLAYRNYKGYAATSMSMAKNVAANSLNTNGSTLANVAVKHATDANATFSKTDIDAMIAMVNGLLGTGTTKGALRYIEEAYIQYIIAYVAATVKDDITYQGIVSDLENNITIEDFCTKYASIINTTSLGSALDLLKATRANVVSAKDTLTEVTTTTTTEGGTVDRTDIAWSEFSSALTLLCNPATMTVNGYTTSQIKNADGSINQAFIESAMKGITVQMASGSGVYADISDHCGDYSASIKLSVSYTGLNINTDARMQTKSSVSPSYLAVIGETVNNTSYQAADNENASKPFSEIYGYILDLSFRTNASDSKLLLQTEAADRIYADNAEDNEYTWGGGSTMKFASASTSFNNDAVSALMKNIRLVIFDPAEGTIFAHAELDMSGKVVTAEGVEAPVRLYKMVEKTVGENTTFEKQYITETKDAEIRSLTQNARTNVSVLVYLDGSTITNKDVAADAAQSMTGSLNLQFSSSANLVPMDYGDYQIAETADKALDRELKKAKPIFDAGNADNSNYSEATWNVFVEKYNAAKTVDENTSASETDVNNAANALKAAREALSK